MNRDDQNRGYWRDDRFFSDTEIYYKLFSHGWSETPVIPTRPPTTKLRDRFRDKYPRSFDEAYQDLSDAMEATQ